MGLLCPAGYLPHVVTYATETMTMKRALPAILALASLSTSAFAQHVLFEEAFENGIPATWRNIQLGFGPDRWRPLFKLVDGTGAVNHEWWCNNNFTFRDNILLSPPIDLSAVKKAYVEFGQWQRFPLGRSYNGVEITIDGGRSYSVVYQEKGTWSGFGSTKIDISAFAGKSKVQIAFHYKGVVANDWSIDNVRVTTSPVVHQISNLVQGKIATFSVSGATPRNGVLMLFSLSGAKPFPTAWGNVNLSLPIFFFPPLLADANGNACIRVPVPLRSAGFKVYSQAVELGLPMTINITNSLAMTIK